MRTLVAVSLMGLALSSQSSWAVDSTISFLTPSVSGGQASQTANSTRLETGNRLYQAVYNPSDWSGDLLEYAVDTAGAVAATGAKSSTSLPQSRRLVTVSTDTDSNGIVDKGIAFTASEMASAAAWSVVSNAVASVQPSWSWDNLIDYLDDGTNLGSVARTRSTVIGDIVNSAPQYSGNFNFGYEVLVQASVTGATSSPGDLYHSFITSGASASRKDMVFVGANDGSLHAFNAESSPALAEVFAYYPQTLWEKLPQLAASSGNYSHGYYVDGSAKVADAFDVNASPGWKTMLVGTTGAGGSALFALDVTDPAQASDDALVQWEINEDTSGYADLGYTLAQASIVLLENGHWAAVVGNGYYSDNRKSLLYIIDLFTGQKITELDTGVISDGLSTPVVADTDGDGAADLAYAGDLDGNLWRFDLSDSNASNWSVSKLFQASHPITAKPQVSAHENGQLVFFGTGKYLEVGDEQQDPDVHAFYGILDKNNGNAADASKLVQQQIVFEDTVDFSGQSFNVRATSDYEVSYTNKHGWFIEFDGFDTADSKHFPEMIVSAPILRNGRVVFTTLIPNGTAYDGSGWLMELDALTGGRLDTVAFDLDNDGEFGGGDKVNIAADGEDPVMVTVSGLQSTVGLISTPNVISAGDKEFKYNSGSDGAIQVTTESTTDEGDTRGHGRTAWQQLQ